MIENKRIKPMTYFLASYVVYLTQCQITKSDCLYTNAFLLHIFSYSLFISLIFLVSIFIMLKILLQRLLNINVRTIFYK